MTPKRERVFELRFHPMKGDFPTIATYPHVNTDLLYANDPQPFHITLPIAEVGRVSGNGLIWDDTLVKTVHEQLSQGAGGISGHIPDDQVDTANPPQVVYWIGSEIVDKTLWAKGYIRPGEVREDTRSKIAIGAGVGTSIYGDAVHEIATPPVEAFPTGLMRKTWKAVGFELDQLDLTKNKRAALKMPKENVAITHEMETTGTAEEDSMPEPIKEITSPSDVPAHIREQIVKDAQVRADAGRVSELSQERDSLKAVVAEVGKLFPEGIGDLTKVKEAVNTLTTYRTIVTEIRQTLGTDADTVETVRSHFETISKLAEMLGVPYTNITVRIEEMKEQVVEQKRKAFEGVVTSTIAEMTPWNVKADDAKKRVAAFRANFQRAIVGELKGETAPEKITTVAKKLWDDEYQYMAKGLVSELAGPGAIIGGKTGEGKPTLASDEDSARARAVTGI